LIREGRDALFAELSGMGKILYEEKAGAFVKRVRGWWNSWR
jgi:hypothetical protein